MHIIVNYASLPAEVVIELGAYFNDFEATTLALALYKMKFNFIYKHCRRKINYESKFKSKTPKRINFVKRKHQLSLKNQILLLPFSESVSKPFANLCKI